MIEWDELSIQTLAVVGRWNDIIEMCENYLRTNPPSAGEQTSESHVRVRICLITALTRINAYEKALNVAEKAIGVYSSNVRDAYVDPSVPFTLKFQHACLPMYLNEDITDKKNPSSAQKKKSKAIQIQNAGVSVLRLYSLQSWCQECHSKEEPLSDLWTLIQERCLRIQSALVEALHFNSSITQSLDMARTLCSATKVVDESTGPSAGEYTSVINREAQTRLLCMHYQHGLGDELKKNLLDNLPSRPECDEHTMKYYRSFQEALLNFHKGLYLAALDGFAFICSTFPGDIAAVNNYAICMVYSALTEKSQNLKSAMQHLESLLKSDTDTFAHPMIVTNLITMYEYAFEEGMLSTKIKSLQDLLRTKGYHPATMKSFLHGRYY